jgi:hypothetical protein
METTQMNRAQQATVDFSKAFAAQSSQEVLDLGSAMIGAGLAYLDAVDAESIDDGIIDSDEANHVTHGLAWMFVEDLEGVEPFNKFCDVLSILTVGKAVGLSPEDRSNVTVRLAQMFGDIVTNIIASTMPYEVSDEDMEKISKGIATQCTGAAIQAAVGLAMEQLIQDKKNAEKPTSEVSPLNN